MIDRGTASLEILAENLKGQTVSYEIGGALKVCYRKEDQIMRIQRKKWDSPSYDEKMLPLGCLDNMHIF